ncbi:MAG: acyl carrier protein [Eubacterium sp.]|jgi:acyl carrier protein|nr:acyl carrier protein [Eubacterium sp.]MBR6218871.1 acyl carrier protein [Eubacterium sp.]HBE09008.1 acyl carrier protein [Lachnospiraceae bacterium]
MFEEVKNILIKQLRLKNVEVLPESRIKDDLGADSVDILQLLMTIEEERGIVIPDERLAEFVTVSDIVNYLEEQK